MTFANPSKSWEVRTYDLHTHIWSRLAPPGWLGRLGIMRPALSTSLMACLLSFINALVFSVNHPPWYCPHRPWAPAQRPTIGKMKAACLPYLPLFPYLFKFFANTMQFNTACKGYDSINQHFPLRELCLFDDTFGDP